jgi:cyclic beta-1,2-glucan synthetase
VRDQQKEPLFVTTTAAETAKAPAPTIDSPGLFWANLSKQAPIRGEIYGLDHLETHARQIASLLRVAPGRRRGLDLPRHFREIGRQLEEAHRRIAEIARREETITVDAEWLLDNFHIVADGLREVEQDLPRGYYHELPKVQSGVFAGLPRVYALALELIAHTDSSLDENNVTRFVQAFQTIVPLSVGELWAVPIMLRLGLLENLARLAGQMLRAWIDRGEAAQWKNRLIERLCQAAPDPGQCAVQLQREARADWSDPFIVQLLQALRDHGPEAYQAIEWLETHLRGRNEDVAEVLHREHQRQAANQVTVGNCVTSLRLLSVLDWTVIFERASALEAELRTDPAGVYGRQDFATRDQYRRVVEKLAKGSKFDEVAIARRAVHMARENPNSTADAVALPARSHCGYYLIGPGRSALETAISYRPKFTDRAREMILAHAPLFYFGALTSAMGLILLGILLYAGRFLVGSPSFVIIALVLLVLATLLPASDLAVGLVHHIITLLLPPRVLPKMDFKDGIPNQCATFVVMPSMLLHPDSGAVLAERLEIHYLSNPDPQLRFGLLTDFADAPAELMPGDAAALRTAVEQIKALNERHAPNGPARFFLFHRSRRWNPVMGCWMGWERKRGKLMEFSRLLRGAKDTSFTTLEGDWAGLPTIRFVITLDADTKLPRDAARRLVAALAHPMNRPRFDPEQGRVVEGHGVLQPRVSLGLAAAARSPFARVYSASAGLDPYTTAVSDVYEDLFDSGTFTGKGIYDVDAFDAAVGRTFPENHILSHDLIEGAYARCGLATDIELLDEFPALYPAYARRAHRWVRGDWQILPWLFRSVPLPEGRRRNPLPAVERWKILDNLRRSLVSPALLALLVLGWTVLPGAPGSWTVLALLVPTLPLWLPIIGSLRRLLRPSSWALHWPGLPRNLLATAGQASLSVVFLADQAGLMIDAIGRTLIRLYFSCRDLLEWETAAATERRLGLDLASSWLNMGVSPVFAILATLLVLWFRPAALALASPILLAWFFAPLVGYLVSRPLPVPEPKLTSGDRTFLRGLARRTWAFFETFVTAEDNWLPPDNYQEDPKRAIAHRTSPTNMGLYLLSALAAHDFGYLSLEALLARLENSFDAFDRLERFHGHLYNWYLTKTLQPLQPAYVSTVDSGNLLACLIALKQGLHEKAEEPIVGPAARLGLEDTVRLVAQALRAVEPPDLPQPVAEFKQLDSVVRRLERKVLKMPASLDAWRDWLNGLHQTSLELIARSQAFAATLHESPEDLLRWARCFADQVRDRREELTAMAPWLELIPLETAGAPVDIWKPLRERLLAVPSVAEMHTQVESLTAELHSLAGSEDMRSDARALVARLREAVERSSASALAERCRRLAERAGALAAGMDFHLLYNEQRHLFSIGYNLGTGRLDHGHYDLLASEASLTSFLTIARNEAPRRHWFQLGRPLTHVAGGIALLSWGGTMFEYLMPRLFVHSYAGTLLYESERAAVARQIGYGRGNRVPWGISESGFNALDAALDYQYQSFGVPGLGLKRGLGRDLVIAPYATALALAVAPAAAVRNFRALSAEKAEGSYGFYEAIDYTHDRLGEKRRPAVVRSYMAHHQGMSLVALANCLLDAPMPRRFNAEPMVKATDLLLQERVQLAAPIYHPETAEVEATPVALDSMAPLSRRVTTPDTPHPRVQLISNRQYNVMLTSAGAGYSTWRDLDVTRWREDCTRDGWGQFCYLRDLRNGLVWSAGHQPIGRIADAYQVVFSSDKAEFHRSDAGIDTHWEITVSPENNAEVRRVTVTNNHLRPHDVELTSYLELALAPHRADVAHPAFAKLFLETEYVPKSAALLCRRRPRAADQKPIWAVHVMAVEGQQLGKAHYETDRGRFLGRGGTPADPAALASGAVLSGTTGPVLDPILSLRCRVRVGPGTSATIAFTTAVAESREEALALADQYHYASGVNRAFELAWAYSQVELRHLHLSSSDAHLYQRLAGHLIYAGPSLRDGAAMAANRQGQTALWRYGISGDRPILLARISESSELPLVRQLLQAHTYWRFKGLEVDLVVLNERPASYREELQEQLQGLVRTSDAHTLVDKPGGVFVRQAAMVSEEDRLLLRAAARVTIAGIHGTLAGWIDRQERATAPAGAEGLRMGRSPSADVADRAPAAPVEMGDLLFPNGMGGFTPDGREYLIRIDPQADSSRGSPRSRETLGREHGPKLPPAPWINVVANPNFGFLISEAGSGYTWAGNSQMNRLTGWNNDPVSDAPSEVVYLRDDDTGQFWSPTPLPCGDSSVIVAHHGQGYTRFLRNSHGLAQEVLLFVPPADPIKLVSLRIRNLGKRVRRLSAAYYAEWVLGASRDLAAAQVICAVDEESGALVAHNPFSTDFAEAVAFADVSLRPRSYNTDRTQFLGRNGSPAAPAALHRRRLTGKVMPGLDPCAALMAPVELAPGEQKEVIFLLGQASHIEEVRRLLRVYREPAQVREALKEIQGHWDRLLTTVQVRTPNRALDLLLNRWLLYQVLSCRVWARSALYQSGGAFGFRDQLQDVMALVYSAPHLTRAQLLLAASRQFIEGDVQHWWHPPSGRGVRTRFSDDLLWLPFVTCHYVQTTGDVSILEERVPFLSAPPLGPEQEEDYGRPDVASETASLYEHCVRALEHGFRLGPHGLPLMGTGDWNDGMNRVGAGGKGESIWNGWFLATILPSFAEIAEKHGDSARAAWCRERTEELRVALESHAWDGRWYLRAYFDNGTPLGSQGNDECKIDSIAQTWAVLSGIANPRRTRQAMEAVEQHLVREADKLVLLFTPPFDRGALQPGYIKGYVPGIRENGGQYTHAAAWVVQATAMLGRGTRALGLLDLLNPIHHAATPEAVATYKVEPYVVAADVYSQPPHVGRGGWTWYTGSASWLYRIALETILGFRLRDAALLIDPCIAAHWSRYEITLHYRTALYHITVENPSGVERGVQSIDVDGEIISDKATQLKDDGRTHAIRVVLG